VGGGVETLPGVRQALAMGLEVAVSDGNPAAPCLAEATYPLVASTYDPAATVAAIRAFVGGHRPVNGVLCMAVDVPHTVAAVAEALGLPGIGSKAAGLAMDKLAMKERLAACGVPVPFFAQVRDPNELAAIVASRGPDLVIKPVDSRGARGVQRLARVADLAVAFAEAARHSPTGRVMVEAFLPGPQVSTESLVVDGRAVTPGFSDRNYEFLERFAPFIIENGGELPCHLPAPMHTAMAELVDRAARALGIGRGVVKGDLVVSGGKPFVIELAARLSGGYFCSHEIPRSTGVDLVGAAIRQCLGEVVTPEELTPGFSRGVAQRWLFAAPGVIESIQGEAAARAVPGVFHLELRAAPGDVVAPVTCHPARLGVVMAEGETREDAVAAAREAMAALRVTIRPRTSQGACHG
jgi:biotin carboxylase